MRVEGRGEKEKESVDVIRAGASSGPAGPDVIDRRDCLHSPTLPRMQLYSRDSV